MNSYTCMFIAVVVTDCSSVNRLPSGSQWLYLWLQQCATSVAQSSSFWSMWSAFLSRNTVETWHLWCHILMPLLAV